MSAPAAAFGGRLASDARSLGLWWLLPLPVLGLLALEQVLPALVLTALVVGFLLRPFDAYWALAATAAVATFTNYEGGHLTRDLAIVSLLLAYTLGAWGLAAARGAWGVTWTSLTKALFLMGALTALNLLRGLAAGYGLKWVALDALPVISLGTFLLAGGLRADGAARRATLVLLLVLGLVHLALGLYVYNLLGTRTGSVYFTAVPAMVALLFLNLALRESRPWAWAGQILVVVLMLLHQFMSFTRGYWLALMVSIPFSFVLYAGRGQGARARWSKAGRVVGSMAAALAVAMILFGAFSGWEDVWAVTGERLLSSMQVKVSAKTASNIARLIEYSTVGEHIRSAPLLGKGLGFTFHVRQLIVTEVSAQWYVHQIYLWMWLKQGLIGLLALLALLGAGALAGMRGSRRLEGEPAAWCAATAACTIHVALVGLTQLGIEQVSVNFLLALLWGMTLSLLAPSRGILVWRRERPSESTGREVSPAVRP